MRGLKFTRSAQTLYQFYCGLITINQKDAAQKFALVGNKGCLGRQRTARIFRPGACRATRAVSCFA
ncbi:MAG TPA: hypothetical protein DCZ49_03300 [Hyphomonadaceae bacterium]|nr:hypothetical protein [Hyphomonadaceae bacterium]